LLRRAGASGEIHEPPYRSVRCCVLSLCAARVRANHTAAANIAAGHDDDQSANDHADDAGYDNDAGNGGDAWRAIDRDATRLFDHAACRRALHVPVRSEPSRHVDGGRERQRLRSAELTRLSDRCHGAGRAPRYCFL
jgi:hypothetical protein